MKKITLRKHTENDETVVKKYMTNADNRHYVKDIDDWSRDKITVVEYDSIIAGYLLASIEKDNCQVFIYISPEYRKNGIAMALFHEAERQCREKGEKEIWGGYANESVKEFAKKIGCYFTSSNLYMEYTGNILPENEKIKNIRKCREEDYLRCQYLWSKGYYELHLRIGHTNIKMSEPEQDFDKDAVENWYVFEENGQVVGCGCISKNAISALAVDTEVNNKGYGTALAIFMTNEILQRGHKTASLDCEAKNDNARHIYEKIGYKVIETSYVSYKKVE